MRIYIESIHGHYIEATTLVDTERVFISGSIEVEFKAVNGPTVIRGETSFPSLTIDNLDIPKIKDTIYDSLGWKNPDKEVE